MKKNSFETQILHTPFEKEDAYHSLSMPVYHTLLPTNLRLQKRWKLLSVGRKLGMLIHA